MLPFPQEANIEGGPALGARPFVPCAATLPHAGCPSSSRSHPSSCWHDRTTLALISAGALDWGRPRDCRAGARRNRRHRRPWRPWRSQGYLSVISPYPYPGGDVMCVCVAVWTPVSGSRHTLYHVPLATWQISSCGHREAVTTRGQRCLHESGRQGEKSCNTDSHAMHSPCNKAPNPTSMPPNSLGRFRGVGCVVWGSIRCSILPSERSQTAIRSSVPRLPGSLATRCQDSRILARQGGGSKENGRLMWRGCPPPATALHSAF